MRSLLLYMLAFLCVPSSVFAHGDESSLSLTINGSRLSSYPVEVIHPHKDFVIPDGYVDKPFTTHQMLSFSIDTVHELNEEELSASKIEWDFGTKKAEGRVIEASFDKPSSYPSTVTITPSTQTEPITYTFLFTVAPDESYTFPEVSIKVNGETLSSYGKAFPVSLTDDIVFSAESDVETLTYRWYFDTEEVAEGPVIIYQFPNAPYIATPILRVTDRYGVFQDIQFTLKNDRLDETRNMLSSPVFLTSVGTITILGVMLFIFLRGISKRTS